MHFRINKSFMLFIVGIICGVMLILLVQRQPASNKMQIITSHSSNPELAAKIYGEEITTIELVKDEYVQFFELEKRLYNFKLAKLKLMALEKMLSSAAKKEGMTAEEFVQKKILQGGVVISESEIVKFSNEKGIPSAQLKDVNTYKRIQDYLKVQKREEQIKIYLARLTKDNPVEKFFNKPKLAVTLDDQGAKAFGKDNAIIKIIEFSDFQCPACKQSTNVLMELKKKYHKNIQIIYRYFPSSGDPVTQLSSEATLCAHEQGPDEFWNFRNSLLSLSGTLKLSELENQAKKVRLDVTRWKACMDSQKFATQMQKDVQYGQKIGIRTSPAYFINNQPVSAPLNLTEASELIEEDLI